MLAEEPFSDRPATACPAVMGFLRGYNDGIGATLRQDLRGLATDLVGSRADDPTTRERARRIHAFGRDLIGTRITFLQRPRLLGGTSVAGCEAVGYALAWRCRRSSARHHAVIAFVRELIGVEAPPELPVAADEVRPPAVAQPASPRLLTRS